MNHNEQQLLNWCYEEIRQLKARVEQLENEIKELKGNNDTGN